MRAQSIDKELAIEVIEANRGVLSNLVAQRVGKLITHPHTEGAIEDIGLGGLVDIGCSVPQYANDNKPYIRGIQGLADFLGVGKSTAQKLKTMGLIPFSQQPWSKIVLFDKEKVKDALQNNSELKKICLRKKRSK